MQRINRRVLVIDDEESVRDGFCAILQPPRLRHLASLDAAARALFDELPSRLPEGVIEFDVETARNGREGIQKVTELIAAGESYAVIFCDMRMPGLDGLETVEGIRKLDRRCEIVFLTAYSDHSLASITERAGVNVSYFVKPFLSEEIRQLATKLVLDWNRARELEELIDTLATLRGASSDLQTLLRELIERLRTWLRADSAVILEVDQADRVTPHQGVGELAIVDPVRSARALAVFRESSPASVIEADGLAFLRIPEFGIAVVAAAEEPMDLGRRYLLEVLLENAGLAIRNSIMRRDMQRKERLATVGQALGFAVHDLNASLGMIEMLARFVEADPHALGPINALAQIRKAAGQARALMHDTLDLCSGSKDIAPRRVRVADELSDAISSWRMLLVERGVALALDLDDDLVAVIDPPLLERALWNLINNASEVLDGRADAVIHVSLQRSAAGLEVIVADNGPGIAADLRAKIFAPFASGKRHGTGFGLAIVKQIVDAHGGDVEVESSSRGASFRLIFPNAIRPEAAK